MKTLVASSRNLGDTIILTKDNYVPSTITPKSEGHTADMHTQFCNRQDHSNRVRRFGFKY
jgi:hypothetical protein